ncbi:hypothetical protein EVJ50_05125 [Synechococcus sp. RSCCF101]|uniref:hypothetical protein n=1 Tax=Synechococcus sp. RSCCF101 TaxID=2511069 RepID=UPI0012458EC8|nr:hypothetical protein [Synechococcus sp. RSCCF101]QEY31719.1 hypothetical protein EVJ50_05125 [Synechococcus sp. RSCCF101]
MTETRLTVLDQLDQLEEVILDGSRIPFSGGRLVNEQEAEELLDAVRDALPVQIGQADALLRQREEFVAQARKQADEIRSQAQQQREQLISSSSVRQEAEKQVAELREQTRQHCEQLLQTTRQKAAQAEQDLQSRLAQMEQQMASRRQQLEQEAVQRRQQLEAEHGETKRQIGEQHERARQQAQAELEQIRQEGLRLQKEAQAEAERLRNDALQFRQQTQQQCESLIQRTRKDASVVQEGADRYAEQTLGEIERRLKEMAQVVLAGRRELVKLQAVDPAELPMSLIEGGLDGSVEASGGGDGALSLGVERPRPVRQRGERRGEAVPISRARRAADRLRQVRGRG